MDDKIMNISRAAYRMENDVRKIGIASWKVLRYKE
jgi:hypothetical protein